MIIDTHAHIGALPPFFDMTTEQVLRSMDKYGVDFTLVSSIEAAEFDHQSNPVPDFLQKPQNRVLRDTLDAVRQAPDRLGALPWLKINQKLVLLRLWGHELTLYRLMRDLGRLAFPIFCFLLIEGFLHTRNKLRYGISLAALAVISEVPFNLVHTGTPWYEKQNVFFTLLLGYLGLCALARFRKKPLLALLCLFGLCLTAYFLKADYGVHGYVFILLLYGLRGHELLRVFSVFILNNFRFALAAFIPISLYNGRRGFIRGAFWKYFFYFIYPAHLMAIYFIQLSIGYQFK